MRARVLLGLAALVAAIPLFVCLLLVVIWLVVGAILLIVTLAAPDSADAAERHWLAPVSGEPTRLFRLGPNPFLRGQHRGVDLAAHGEPVRAACAGPVVFAGRVAGAGTVSVRCGAWRVSYAPLTRVAVREGERIGAGARLGRSAGGIHFGVRREGRRFGYVDPLRFLDARAPAPPPLVAPPQAVRGRRPPAPAAPRGLPARPLPARPRPARPPPARAHAPPRVAPWPVWLGLALLLTGLVGTGRMGLTHRLRERAAPCASPASR